MYYFLPSGRVNNSFSAQSSYHPRKPRISRGRSSRPDIQEKNINAGKFSKSFATISAIIIMGDKLANILAQSFRFNLKFQLDISAKLASGLKKLRHQMNVFLGILTKRA